MTRRASLVALWLRCLCLGRRIIGFKCFGHCPTSTVILNSSVFSTGGVLQAEWTFLAFVPCLGECWCGPLVVQTRGGGWGLKGGSSCLNLSTRVRQTTHRSGKQRWVTADWMVLIKHFRQTTLCWHGRVCMLARATRQITHCNWKLKKKLKNWRDNCVKNCYVLPYECLCITANCQLPGRWNAAQKIVGINAFEP